MFNYLLKGLLAGLAVKVLNNYRHLSVQLLKLEEAVCYLRGVQLARLSALAIMWVSLAICFIGLGLLLAHIGLFVLLPWTVESKALLAVALGCVYVLMGSAVLRVALCERTWLEKSGASKMFKEATDVQK